MNDDRPYDDDAEPGHGFSERDVAVIGMAGRFPAARDLRELWHNLENGVEAVTFLADEELLAAGVPRASLARPDYVKAASLLDGVEEFDADFFGFNARDAEILDPQQRLFLEYAWSALEDAGHVPERFDGLIGVYAGVAWNTYLLSNLMSHRELFDGAGAFQIFITNDKDFMPTRVSYKLNLKGPSVIVQTSCSTSLVATHLACLGLQSYECDMALVGGVTVKVPGKAGYFYQEGGLASPDGHCRAFDAGAAGTIFGSGIGVVVLRRLADALAAGDPIRAVIRGSAINNDGSVKVSYTAPSVEGQAEVVAAALEMAGVDPATLRYIECHGTGTSLGDPIEVRALTKVFHEQTDKEQYCALGSIKSNVGHLDAAAGVAGLIKTVLALEHRRIPPSLHYEEPNPAIDFAASPFYVAAKLEEWTADAGAPRRAGVSSFGVGGTNAHVILEEAPPAAASGPSRSWQLLVLSAKSAAALDRAAAGLRAFLEDPAAAAVDLADVAYTLRVGRATWRHRRALVCRDRADAVALLAGERLERSFAAVDGGEPRERPVAFLFSGQGSQYSGMGRGLYDAEAVFQAAVDRLAGKLEPPLGHDLRQVMWPANGDEARLGRTRFTQPALFVIELALTELWRSWGVTPQAMLGHSIGEYVAACVAGVMSEDDALRLVAERGRLMDELPGGAMLAVPLAEEELAELLGAREDLAVAALNEPARSVVSGPEEAVAAFESTLAERGVEGRRLHTSHAFHSAMMDPVLEAFTAAVRRVELRAPEIPFVSNVSGTWITAAEATDPAYWARHLRQAVRFADGVATLAEDAERLFLEVGPGRALATLASRHPARRPEQPVLTSLRHPRDAGDDLAHALVALGELWLAGRELDPEPFYAGERRRRVALPTYPFERTRYWIEAGVPTAAAVVDGGLRQKPDIADWFYLPSWKPAPLVHKSGETPASWLLLTADDGPVAALAARLRDHGKAVVTVAPGASGSGLVRTGEGAYALDPGHRDGYGELLDEMGSVPEAVVHAWSLTDGGAPAADARSFDAAQTVGFSSLLALVQAVAGRAAAGFSTGVDVTVVADGLRRITAGEPLYPEKATLLGLCRVLPQELPGVRCRAVDVVRPQPASRRKDELVDQLLAEIAAGVDDVVAYRGRQRWVEAFEPVRLPEPDTAPLRERGVYLLTGGLQGNGYAFARYLARRAAARLVLLEEQEPSAGGRQRVARLEELGAEVHVLIADLADVEAWRRWLAETEERCGPVNGILHTAGTVGQRTFRSLSEIDDEHLSWHFGPKIHGTLALEQALLAGDRPELDFCLLLSSLASVLGGLAYGAYAAANHFLDAFAQERRARAGASLPWRSVGWDVLELPEEREQITSLRADLAALAMTPLQGEEALERLLAWDFEEILVSTGDLAARLAERRRRIAAHRGVPALGATAGPRHPRPPLPTPYAAPENDLERRIAAVWQELLGFEGIGVNDNFFDLGGDSFVAVRVAARLREALEIDLPVAQLYQRLTVRSLAELLVQDAEELNQAHAAQLAARRESMDRRKELIQRRRSRKKATVIE